MAMTTRKRLPVALTIAGSDSGGGAGIQADLKTFAALGVHGTSAIACLTAQNPRRVLAVESCSPKMLRQQIEAVFEELRPAAVNTGVSVGRSTAQMGDFGACVGRARTRRTRSWPRSFFRLSEEPGVTIAPLNLSYVTVRPQP